MNRQPSLSLSCYLKCCQVHYLKKIINIALVISHLTTLFKKRHNSSQLFLVFHYFCRIYVRERGDEVEKLKTPNRIEMKGITAESQIMLRYKAALDRTILQNKLLVEKIVYIYILYFFYILSSILNCQSGSPFLVC